MLKFGCTVVMGLILGLFLGFALLVVGVQLLNQLLS